MTIDNNQITYYVDGQHFGTHGAAFLPERPMSINFNQWLIDLEGQPSTTPRSYDQQVDYVLHVKDQVLTPAQVNAMVGSYRSAGKTFEDTVPGSSRALPAGSGTHGVRTGRAGVNGSPRPAFACPGGLPGGVRRRSRHRSRTPPAAANFAVPP
ncbi:hypothetical protein SCYAM73S_02740 [Streptomyces cyaneofuscatus]